MKLSGVTCEGRGLLDMLRIVAFPMMMLLLPLTLEAQSPQKERDAFVPIGKYISLGDAESLSTWFANNLEINILGKVSDCSKRQATQIVKDFFTTYKVKSFNVVHKSGRAPMKYAIGTLQAGGQSFRVTLFLRTNEDGNKIQQFTIERE